MIRDGRVTPSTKSTANAAGGTGTGASGSSPNHPGVWSGVTSPPVSSHVAAVVVNAPPVPPRHTERKSRTAIANESPGAAPASVISAVKIGAVGPPGSRLGCDAPDSRYCTSGPWNPLSIAGNTYPVPPAVAAVPAVAVIAVTLPWFRLDG